MESFPILFRSRWSVRGLDTSVTSLDPDALCAEYAKLRSVAPRRSRREKPYFVGHSGVASAARQSNRLEEHLAIALVNLARCWPRPDGGWFRLLDYQVPLKARRKDARVGKIDLLGATDRGRLVVIELKVDGSGRGRGDPPPVALMEGLRYAAMLEADHKAIAAEAGCRFGTKIAKASPLVLLMGPEAWWRSWLDLPAAGDWGPAFARLVEAVEAVTGVTVECMALEDTEVAFGLDGKPPRLDRVPRMYPVEPGGD